ncbi:hypothetical protein AAMO2058_001305700 [Amorphochlora amoebiformis]
MEIVQTTEVSRAMSRLSYLDASYRLGIKRSIEAAEMDSTRPLSNGSSFRPKKRNRAKSLPRLARARIIEARRGLLSVSTSYVELGLDNRKLGSSGWCRAEKYKRNGRVLFQQPEHLDAIDAEAIHSISQGLVTLRNRGSESKVKCEFVLDPDILPSNRILIQA